MSKLVELTLEIEDTVFEEARLKAAEEGTTVEAILLEALVKYSEGPSGPPKEEP